MLFSEPDSLKNHGLEKPARFGEDQFSCQLQTPSLLFAPRQYSGTAHSGTALNKKSLLFPTLPTNFATLGEEFKRSVKLACLNTINGQEPTGSYGNSSDLAAKQFLKMLNHCTPAPSDSNSTVINRNLFNDTLWEFTETFVYTAEILKIVAGADQAQYNRLRNGLLVIELCSTIPALSSECASIGMGTYLATIILDPDRRRSPLKICARGHKLVSKSDDSWLISALSNEQNKSGAPTYLRSHSVDLFHQSALNLLAPEIRKLGADLNESQKIT